MFECIGYNALPSAARDALPSGVGAPDGSGPVRVPGGVVDPARSGSSPARPARNATAGDETARDVNGERGGDPTGFSMVGLAG